MGRLLELLEEQSSVYVSPSSGDSGSSEESDAKEHDRSREVRLKASGVVVVNLGELVNELNESKERLQADLSHAEQQLASVAASRNGDVAGKAEADRERRVLEDSLITLQEKNRRLEAHHETFNLILKRTPQT